jgi:ATP-dependent helicase/nuclease subunit A
MLKREVLGSSKRQELMDGIRTYQGDLASRLKEKFDAQYPYEYLKGLFTKTTVTELKKHKLEEMGEVFGHSADYADDQDRYDDLIVTDMQGEMPGDIEANTENADKKPVKRLTGAERGTAYHRIMEILDEDIFGNEDFMEAAEKARATVAKENAEGPGEVSKKIYSWMQLQHKKGMIPEEYVSSVWSPDVTAFLSSELGQRMGRAYRRGELVREKPFMMGIPASDLDDKYPSDEMVLIQGIIDAWFIEDGQIVLMDYKTDKVSEGQELIDRYSIQLQLYKRALESATDMKVKEVLIYAFALGETIKFF